MIPTILEQGVEHGPGVWLPAVDVRLIADEPFVTTRPGHWQHTLRCA